MNATAESISTFTNPPVQHPGIVPIAGSASAREGWDDVDAEKDFESDFDMANDFSASPDVVNDTRNDTVNNGMVETDDGKRVRVPSSDSYRGEAPYNAPLTGFHGKIAEVFDAFAYMPNGQVAEDRPSNFLPIVGMVGDDKSKNENPAWKLFGRLRPDVYEQVKDELGDINANAIKPVILVTQMRAENIALFSISQPHQIFAPSLWLAALPISVMKIPMQTLEEPKIRAIVLAERAKAEVSRAQIASVKSNEQMSLGF